MKFKKLSICFILAFSTLVLSCQTKQDRINEFVKNYNAIENSIVKNYVKSTKAEKIDENEIKLTISLSIMPDETVSQMYRSMFPELMKEIITSFKFSKKLINEGVKFSFFLLADDQSVVVSQIFDKEYFNDNKNKNNGLFTKSDKIDIYKLAEIMNKGLPVVDSINNITILKIEILNDKEAQFLYIVPELTVDVLIQNKDVINLMKDELLRDKKQKKAIMQFFNLGLEKFYFVFTNKDRTKTKRIEFTKKDLLN